MNIRTPQPTQAARLLVRFFASQGITIRHTQALEAVARLHGYQDWQALNADVRFQDAPALTPVSSNEYELRKGERSAWVGVDNISVSVTRTDEGVCVDLYAKGHEDDSLAGTSLFFHEASEAAACPSELESDFQPTKVAWSMVTWTLGELTHLRLNNGPLCPINLINTTGLTALDKMPQGLNAHVRMAQDPGFEYVVPESSPLQIAALTLGMLQQACEYEEGVLDLVDGRRLELLWVTPAEPGAALQVKRYSPANNCWL